MNAMTTNVKDYLSPQDSCENILQVLKCSNLHFVLQETPHSVYITLRKRFLNNSFPSPTPNQKTLEKLARLEFLAQTVSEENVKLEEDLAAKDAKIDALEKDNGSLQTENNSLNAEVNQSREIISNMTNLICEKENEIKTSKDIAKNLQSELQNIKNNLKGTSKNIKVLEKENHNLKSKNENLSENLGRSKSEFASLLAEKKKLEKIKSKLERKNEKTSSISTSSFMSSESLVSNNNCFITDSQNKTIPQDPSKNEIVAVPVTLEKLAVRMNDENSKEDPQSCTSSIGTLESSTSNASLSPKSSEALLSNSDILKFFEEQAQSLSKQLDLTNAKILKK